MKNSNVDWIGQIPDDWQTKTVRECLVERVDKNKDLSEKTILSLSAKEGVTLYNGENHSGNKPKEDLSGCKIVKINDIVANSMNILSGSVGLSDYNGVVSPVYYIYYNRKKENDIRFFSYIFQCQEFQKNLRRLGKGILIKETEDGKLNTIRTKVPSKLLSLENIPYPSPEKQKKIVEFLDKKCSEIDKLIEVENQQIEKLKEYRTSVVFNALTKSLIKERELKDCNLPWISKMPLGWNVCKIKHIAKLETGSTPPTTNPGYFDGKINWFTPGDFKDLEVSDSARKITDTAVADGYKPYPLFSTLLIGIGGTAGKVAYMTAEGYSNQQITALIPKSIENKYLFYLMNSLSQYIKDNAHYTTLPIINNSYLGNVKVIIAPKNEQKEIVEYLDDKCVKIVNLISLKNKKIKWIQEYKKSIIYEYITGKKEIV